MLTSGEQHILSLASWQLAKEMETDSVALDSYFILFFWGRGGGGGGEGMTWLVATIFDSAQFKVCMCKLGMQKKVIVSKPSLPNCYMASEGTGRGKFTMATEHSRYALPHSICCLASTDLWSTSMKETFLLM